MRDEWFIRGKVPMTKSEVRAVSISRLELAPDSVLWDVGAGTGSVSVEASFLLPEGQVYAVEKNPQAVELIRRNREKFGRDNLTVISGDAPGALGQLPDPTHVFLGGSGGRMGEILDLAMGRNPRVRVVINIISLESLGEAVSWLERRKISGEIVSLQAARGRRAGRYHLMEGQNPVYVITFGGEESPWAEEFS